MPHISERKESRFLTKTDCGAGKLLTIDYVDTNFNIANEGEPPQIEWVAHFKEEDVKPFILKSINLQLISNFSGRENTDDWGNLKIVAYHDPSVTMKGKVTGGIRVRAPKASALAAMAAPRAASAVPPPPVLDEDVPF